MLARLAVICLAIPPVATVAANSILVPQQCARLAAQAGLPPRLNPQQVELALAMLDRSQDTSDEMRNEIRRCQQAVKRRQRLNQ